LSVLVWNVQKGMFEIYMGSLISLHCKYTILKHF
jgi:hypothetical protein